MKFSSPPVRAQIYRSYSSCLPYLATEIKKDPLFKPIKFTTGAETNPEVTAETWTPAEKRSGLLAVKKGMLSTWDKWGRHTPVTALQVLYLHD
jgi:hypothetical protein